MRKQILGQTSPTIPTSVPGELNIDAIATALVTSETPDHPIEHAFDDSRGPGGTFWLASADGEQTVTLAFDAPQALRGVHLEIEEQQVSRTQELQLAISQDGGKTYREILRQEYNFSPPGTVFEREDWTVGADGVTHLRLWIKPDKSGHPCRASITSFAVT